MDRVLFENFVRQVNQFAKASKLFKPKAKQWYLIGKSDLEISKILLKNGFFAASVYHLQQSYEKFTKSYFILTGRTTPEQARSHKFNLIKLKKEIKDQFVGNTFELMKAFSDEKNKPSLEKIKLKTELLDAIDKKEDEIRTIDEKGIKIIFNLIDRIEIALSNPHFIKSLEKKIRHRRFKKNLRHLLFMITHFRVSYSQVDEMISSHNVKRYIQNSLMSIKLLLLGLITFLHYNTPRYPYDKHSNVTYFDYQSDLGIVKCLGEFHQYGGQIGKNLEEIHFAPNSES